MNDVNKMTAKERSYFFEYLKEDLDHKNDQLKRN